MTSVVDIRDSAIGSLERLAPLSVWHTAAPLGRLTKAEGREPRLSATRKVG